MALNNAQYDFLMKEYQKKQLHNKHILDNHYQEVYQAHPDIEKLDQSISTVSVEHARKLLDGKEAALSSLKEDLKKLSARRQKLLNVYGYPDNYLTMTYDCEECHDTGYVNNQKCVCFKQASIDLLYTQSNIKDILETENFDHFNLAYYSDHYIDPTTGQSALSIMKSAVTVSQEFIQTFGDEFRNLFFYGDTGVGKTFLSNCIARELINKGFSVIYLTVYQLFDIFAKVKFSNNNTEETDIYKYIFECDLLIIDDLGTELTNAFVSSELFLCLNERILRKKSTIISTNLSLETLTDTYSERTFSRISSNYTMLKLAGDDIRILKKLKAVSSKQLNVLNIMEEKKK